MILTYLPGPCVVFNDVNTARKELLSSLHRKASLIHRIVCARSREALLVSDRGFAFTNYGTVNPRSLFVRDAFLCLLAFACGMDGLIIFVKRVQGSLMAAKEVVSL